MLFNLEQDRGDSLSGYLVPDSFRGRCEISIRVAGREVWRTPTFERRTSLVEAGRHENGLCGYTLDARLLSELASLPDIAIHDAATSLLVARRCRPEAVIARRVVRLETHLLPLRGLDEALRPRFGYGYVSLDRVGGETAAQVFTIADGGSLYASGRMSYRSMQGLLEPLASGVIVLRDPYLELAERLIVLNRVAATSVELFGERDALIWAPAVAYFAGLDVRDMRGLRRAVEAMPPRVAQLLSSPLARLLACQPGEEARPRHVAPALRALSRLTLVGLREDWMEFRERLAVLLGLPPEALPVVGEFSAVQTLAAELRTLRAATRLLAVDLELYARVRDAFEASCAAGPEFRHEATAGGEAA